MNSTDGRCVNCGAPLPPEVGVPCSYCRTSTVWTTSPQQAAVVKQDVYSYVSKTPKTIVLMSGGW